MRPIQPIQPIEGRRVETTALDVPTGRCVMVLRYSATNASESEICAAHDQARDTFAALGIPVMIMADTLDVSLWSPDAPPGPDAKAVAEARSVAVPDLASIRGLAREAEQPFRAALDACVDEIAALRKLLPPEPKT